MKRNTVHKCNICGIPESQWENGRCNICEGGCDMIPSVVIEQRVFNFAKKKNLLFGETFHVQTIFGKLCTRKYALPKYFRDAIAHDGQTFSSLSEFPKNKVFVVCRDSKDGTFQVGILVWRGEPAPGGLDGINFVYDAACLDAEDCDVALEGAMFEDSFRSIEEFRLTI